MTPWTVGHQAPLSMGFPRPEYWSGLPFPSPGDLPDPGNEPGSPALQVDSLPSESPGKLRIGWVCPISNDEYPYKRQKRRHRTEERRYVDRGRDWSDVATTQEQPEATRHCKRGTKTPS